MSCTSNCPSQWFSLPPAWHSSGVTHQNVLQCSSQAESSTHHHTPHPWCSRRRIETETRFLEWRKCNIICGWDGDWWRRGRVDLMVTWQLSRKPLKNYLHITTFSKLTVYIGEIVASKLLSTLLCQSIFRLCRLTTFQYLPSFLVTLDNTHNTLPLMPLFTLLLMHDLAWQY